MENFSIRIAEEKDAKEIHDIYDYYVKNTAVTFSTENPTVEEYKKQIAETKKKLSLFCRTRFKWKNFGIYLRTSAKAARILQMER